MKIIDFSSPKPGRALTRADRSAASAAPVHTSAASPPWWSTRYWQRMAVRLPIEPGKRCRAGLAAKTAATASGPIAAISPASRRPPRRSLRRAGPRKAHDIGTCWSSNIPIISARGDSMRTWSSSGLPVMGKLTSAIGRRSYRVQGGSVSGSMS